MKQQCECCHRKLRLAEAIRFQCKCKKILCSNHQSPSRHDCSFDYKQQYKATLKQQLPEVKSRKVPTI